jgi:hypothetical protein
MDVGNKRSIKLFFFNGKRDKGRKMVRVKKKYKFE